MSLGDISCNSARRAWPGWAGAAGAEGCRERATAGRGDRPARIPDARGRVRRRRARQSAAVQVDARTTPRGRLGPRDLAARSHRRPAKRRPDRTPALQGARHRTGLDRPDGLGRETRRALHEGHDLLERGQGLRHGAVGGRAAPRSDRDDAARGQPAPRLVPRLPQRPREARARGSRVRCRSTACWKTRRASSR